jgi:hypothetical protein
MTKNEESYINYNEFNLIIKTNCLYKIRNIKNEHRLKNIDNEFNNTLKIKIIKLII